MVEAAGALVLDQELQDRRHGEDRRDPPALDQLPGGGDVEALGGHQHGLHAAGDLGELVDAGAVRERRDDERGVGRGEARHQVAEVVDDDEGHLAVGQHRGLRPAGGAGGEEEPAGVVALDRHLGGGLAHVLGDERVPGGAEAGLADRDGEAAASQAAACSGKAALQIMADGAGGLRQVGDLVGGLAEVRRHVDRADAEAGEHRLEHLVAVLRLHEDAVALPTPKRDCSAAAIASIRASSSAQVQVFSPQTSAIACGSRRRAWVTKCARFITRVEQGATPPGGPAHFARSRIET